MLPGHSPWHHKASLLLLGFSSMYSDRGFERPLQYSCRQMISGYTRWDSGRTHTSPRAVPPVNMVQIHDLSWPPLRIGLCSSFQFVPTCLMRVDIPFGPGKSYLPSGCG